MCHHQATIEAKPSLENRISKRVKRWKAILDLGRISNLPTVWSQVLTGWGLLALSGNESAQRLTHDFLGRSLNGASSWLVWIDVFKGQGFVLLWLLLSGSGFYLSGMTLNDVADVKWDRAHGKGRPLAQGLISLQAALMIGIAWMALGWVFGLLAGIPWGCLAAITFLIGWYEVSHKKWAGAVWVMGGIRSLLYVMGALAAISHGLGREAAFLGRSVAGIPLSFFSIDATSFLWIATLALGLYVCGITLIARGESGRISKFGFYLGWLFLWAPVILALTWMHRHAEAWSLSVYGGAFMLIGWIAWAWKWRPQGNSGLGVAVGRLLAGMVLVDGLAWMVMGMPVAMLVLWLGLALLLRSFQRWIAAN